MQEIIIDDNSSGQRVDRFLQKYLPKASKVLIQKSLRKKNIKVNGKKAEGKYFLKHNDVVQIFFSDDTISKFKDEPKEKKIIPANLKKLFLNPIFENEDLIAINKPINLLTQPDKKNEVSVSDIINDSLKNDSTFNPAPLNRLDRNTSGIILIPKNYQTQKLLAQQIKEHNTEKKYLTLVKGVIKSSGKLSNSYDKDSKENKAILAEGDEISLAFEPLFSRNGYTLLSVNLLTGKSHQIRSQLNYAGFPIIGDPKYGDKEENILFRNKYKINNQLLHAYNYKIFDDEGNLLYDIKAPLPDLFKRVLDDKLKIPNGLLEETT